jgi:hypothetical protein
VDCIELSADWIEFSDFLKLGMKLQGHNFLIYITSALKMKTYFVNQLEWIDHRLLGALYWPSNACSLSSINSKLLYTEVAIKQEGGEENIQT